ncbi:MAG: lipopolysaccharide transport system permease protein [Psychroserpens sp.]
MKYHLITELTKRDFVERFSGSILGFSWLFIWPIINISIYILVFGKLIGARLPNIDSTFAYGIYLVSGLLPWLAFSNTVVRITTVFVDKKPIISKIKVNLLSFPIYIVLSESIVFLISMLMFCCFYLVLDFPALEFLYILPFVFIVQQLFAYALGLIFAMLFVFVRDIREFVGVLIQVWFWLTPIVYTVDILPQWVAVLVQFNPAYVFVGAYQNIILLNSTPNFHSLFLLAGLCLIVIVFARKFCYKLEKDIRDTI